MKRMYAALAGSAGLFLLLVWQAESARAGALWGLQLCAQLLVPSLLPFFVAAGLMNRLGLTQALGRRLTPLGTRLFRVSGRRVCPVPAGLSADIPWARPPWGIW